MRCISILCLEYQFIRLNQAGTLIDGNEAGKNQH